ncbi:hypothetical protein REPUB_Repub17cG0156000 [Reevesia pubescens]
MKCRGTNVVPVTCLAERLSFASRIQLRPLAFFFKMRSIYRPRNGFMFCLGQFACIFRLIAVISGNDELEDASEILNCFTDVVICTVCACMQIEMEKRDGKFGPPTVMIVPPVQQMSRKDQPVPPAIGHPPQPQQWQPPYGYAYAPTIPGYPAVPPAYSLPPPGYPAAATPVHETPGYFPAGCPPPTQHFPAVRYPPPRPQGYYN